MAENNTILMGVRAEPSGNAPAGKMYIWIDAVGVIWTKDDAGNLSSSIGVTNHANLTGRNSPDQHDIASVTGLQNALDGKLDTSAVSVFGTYHSDSHRNDTVTSSSVTPVVYVTNTVINAPAGRYRLGASATWGLNTAGRNIIITWKVNGTIFTQLEAEPKDAGSDIRNLTSGFGYMDHPGGNIVTEMEFAPESAGDVARIHSGTLEQWRVS